MTQEEFDEGNSYDSTMTEEQLKEFLLEFWKRLGEKYGFDYASVEPIEDENESVLCFLAIPMGTELVPIGEQGLAKRKKKKIHWSKVLEDIKISLPTIVTPRPFTILNVKMDKDFKWTVTLAFAEFVEILEQQYNIVIFRAPAGFESSMEGMVRNAITEENKKQMELGEINDDPDLQSNAKKVDTFKNINEIIRSWNDAINMLGVTNIHARLDKFTRKQIVKEMTFTIHKDCVSFFKDDYVPGEAYVACMEQV